MFTREDIIIQARTWLDTKFRYQGRIKKNKYNDGGVDCLGLVFGVFDELNYKYNNKLLSYYDTIVYSKQPDFNILKEKFSLFFKIKNINELDIGDIILKKVSIQNYHLMFYNKNTVIHSSAISHKVIENKIDNLDNIIIYSSFR